MQRGYLVVVLSCALSATAFGRHAFAEPSAPVAIEGDAVTEPAKGELSLSVGARVERGVTRTGLLGFAALNVPLERLAQAPRPTLAVTTQPLPAPEATPTEASEATLERSGSSPSPAVERVSPLIPAPELARLSREAVAVALRANGTGSRNAELDRMASRARASAALPELRVRGQRSDDESLRLTPTTEDPYRYSVAGGRDWLVEAQLTFRLARLVFADEELPIERLRLERERNAARTAARVLERLFDWHRALSLAQASELDPEARLSLELKALEAEVELDVLTGGYFSAKALHYREIAARVPETPPMSSGKP
jgi:hypothetical protein